jgi:oligoribonuclease
MLTQSKQYARLPIERTVMKMYLWIDLETTGLDPDNDRIIEVGWFLSNGFEQITDEQSVIITPDKIAWELMQQDLFVQTMHTENDLIKDMDSFGTILIEDAEDQILEDLSREDDQLFTLAGASVHFDRGFIRNWMPRLERKLSHRHMDVSTLRMFFDEMGYASIGERQNIARHRALDDVVDTFYLAKRYEEFVTDFSNLTTGAEDA